MVISLSQVIALINNNSKLPYQNDSRSPDNGIINVVGVKVVDPEDGHEERNQDHDGQDSPRKAQRHDAFFSQEVFV